MDDQENQRLEGRLWRLEKHAHHASWFISILLGSAAAFGFSRVWPFLRQDGMWLGVLIVVAAWAHSQMRGAA
jgi:hypothetical protein